MRTVATIALLLVWIPAAFLLTGFSEAVITGERNGLSALGWAIAMVVWIGGSVAIVRYRRRRRAAAPNLP